MKTKTFNFDDHPNSAGHIELEKNKLTTRVILVNQDNQRIPLFSTERDQWGTFYEFDKGTITVAHEDYTRNVGESLLKAILYILTNTDPEYCVSKEKVLEKISNILDEL